MTTTISYNGSTIATVENQSKTLTTAGKYVPYSFVVTDVTSGAGGGYSVDDIAKLAISGNVSGSASYVGSYAFTYCNNLTGVDFPSASIIGAYAFFQCTNLVSASFPTCEYINTGAFQYCYSLENITFTELSSIGTYAFEFCSALTNVDFPDATIIDSYAFFDCINLSSVSVPNVTEVRSCAFYDCRSLATISLPQVTTIGSFAFGSCPNLVSIYLPGSSIASLASTNVFTDLNSSASFFVPASLYDSYISADNWSDFSSRFVSISDNSSSSIPATLVAKFVKRWYDTGSTASCDTMNHYTTLPNTPV